jgi:polyisoprenoid-binding protein YceI
MDLKRTLRRPRSVLIGVVAIGVLVAVVAPYVYIHFIAPDAAPRLTLTDATGTTTTTVAGAAQAGGAPTTVAGTWKVTSGSAAGYRVQETLLGQGNEATGRTADITGSLTITGTSVDTATFDVDLTTVTSDESLRDRQFQGRIMNTAKYPKATFTLSKPITLDAIPGNLQKVSATATGELTMHGVTKSVTFTVSAQLNGTKLEVNGTIPITFSDYSISNPSGGSAVVGDTGELEFLVVLTRAS